MTRELHLPGEIVSLPTFLIAIPMPKNKYFKNIEIEYKDYKVVQGEKCVPSPQIVIEKISHDNSLYLQITLMVSGMHYDFLKEHEIDKVAIVNNLEKKISICDVDISRISEAVEDVIKLLVKNQKNHIYHF